MRERSKAFAGMTRRLSWALLCLLLLSSLMACDGAQSESSQETATVTALTRTAVATASEGVDPSERASDSEGPRTQGVKPPSVVSNPSFCYRGKQRIAQLDEALFYIAGSFLYRMELPLSADSIALLSLDTRPLTSIAAERNQVWKNDAFFHEAVGVFAHDGRVGVIHRKLEQSSTASDGTRHGHVLTILAPQGCERQILAELPGMTGSASQEDEWIFYTARRHDDQNRPILELQAVSMRSGAIQTIVRLEDDILETVDKVEVASLLAHRGHVVVQLEAYLTKEGETELDTRFIVVDAMAGTATAFAPQREWADDERLAMVHSHGDGLIFAVQHEPYEVTRAVEWYRSSFTGEQVEKLLDLAVGNVLRSDGEQLWRVPSEVTLIAHSTTIEEQRQQYADFLDFPTEIVPVTDGGELLPRSVAAAEDGWPDITMAFVFLDKQVLGLGATAGTVLAAERPQQDDRAVTFARVFTPEVLTPDFILP